MGCLSLHIWNINFGGDAVIHNDKGQIMNTGVDGWGLVRQVKWGGQEYAEAGETTIFFGP